VDETVATALVLMAKQARRERKIRLVAESHASNMDAELHAAEAELHRAEASVAAARSMAARSYARGVVAAMDGARLPVLIEGDQVEIRMGEACFSGTVVRHGLKLGIEVPG
jgi:hypothetical protein